MICSQSKCIISDLWLLTCISPNLYFHTLLLLEVYKISAKKVRRGYVSWHWRVMQNLKKSWFVVSRIWWILTQALKSLKNVHFDWFLLCKVENTWVKNLQRIYVYWHWRMIKTLKRNWIVVSKLTSQSQETDNLEARAVLIEISVMLKFTERPKTAGITSKKT